MSNLNREITDFDLTKEEEPAPATVPSEAQVINVKEQLTVWTNGLKSQLEDHQIRLT